MYIIVIPKPTTTPKDSINIAILNLPFIAKTFAEMTDTRTAT